MPVAFAAGARPPRSTSRCGRHLIQIGWISKPATAWLACVCVTQARQGRATREGDWECPGAGTPPSLSAVRPIHSGTLPACPQLYGEFYAAP